MNDQKTPGYEFAIVSLTLGILTFVQFMGLEKPIVAIVFGVLALKRLQLEALPKFRRFAKAGITIGIIGIIVIIAARIYVLPRVLQQIDQMKVQRK